MDPLAQRENRSLRHAGERIQYYDFLAAHSLQEDLPSMVGQPGGDFSEVDFTCAPCRVALGDGSRVPSLLDHHASRHVEGQILAEINWSLQSGDHAFLSIVVPSKSHIWEKRRRSTWRCDDRDKTEAWFSLHSPEDFGNVQHILDFCRRAQKESPCKSTAAEGRKLRGSPQIERLRAGIRSCKAML